MRRLFILFAAVSTLLGQANLLSNSGFESGVSGWSGLSAGNVTASGAHSGTNRVRLIAGSTLISQTVAVQPGHTYVLIGWIRMDAFTGTDWGYFRMAVGDGSMYDESVNSRNLVFPSGIWVKKAVTFVPRNSSATLEFGVFGPQTTVNLSFDDFAIIEKGVNKAPFASPTASSTSITAGQSVTFTANADDTDGSVEIFSWDFGDGSSSIDPVCAHSFKSAGTYPVQLTIWDNDLASARYTVTVVVSTGAGQPAIRITQPADADTFTTTSTSVTLSGTLAAAANRSIVGVSWDNVNRGSADTAAAAGNSWNAGSILLKPGRNELLVTAVDDSGQSGFDRIVVTRTVSGPQIAGISNNRAVVPVYGKFESVFLVSTAAEHPFFSYDPTAPQGQKSGIGVTVEAIFTLPGGGTVRQPAFYLEQSSPDQFASSGEPSHFAETDGIGRFCIRFSPLIQGDYSFVITARDTTGFVSVSGGNFTAVAPQSHGYIRVSAADSRFFEYSDGTFHFPVGPAHEWTSGSDKKGVFNFSRPWMGGTGAYSTNWSRWKSTGEQWGNEGAVTPLSYTDHYPGHDLSYKLWAGAGRRIWLTSWCDDRFYQKLRRNAVYRVSLRCKTQNLSGPINQAYASGLMIKTHAWPGDSLERDLRSSPSILPVISKDRDWHTLVTRYTHTSDNNDISLYLDNVSTGEAYIDRFSMREIKAGGSLGGELIRNPDADQHTYVEQRPAAWFDCLVTQGESTGVAYQFVVQDKNDWIPNHLSVTGIFHESGTGYYAADNTRTRWLQQQWWRYCQARWGYSTAVRAWELCNEGPPADSGSVHAETARSFAQFLNAAGAHRHLAGTSFWAGWKPAFWRAARYAEISYADRHAYTEGDTMAYDMAGWIEKLSNEMFPDNVGKPIIIAETGISTGFGPVPELETANDGTWYHNLLWAQLNPAAVSAPNYWFSEHFAAINKDSIGAPFAGFVLRLDLNRGGYAPLAATGENPNLRAWGQKNLSAQKAYVWIQNKTHTWAAVMGVNNKGPVVPQSGAITIRLAPDASYPVSWYNTYSGAVDSTVTRQSDASGDVVITVSNLQKDVALLIGDFATHSDAKRPLPEPLSFGILSLQPNPFNPAVRIQFAVPEKAVYQLRIVDIAGRVAVRLLNAELQPGRQAVVWNAAECASGAYFVSLVWGKKTAYKKLILLR